MKEGQAALLDRGLRRLQQRAHLELAVRLDLAAIPVPPEFARAEGSFGSSAVTMHTHRYRGEHFTPLTMAVLEVEAQLCSLTVIGLPPLGSSLPVLGLDLIALRGALSLVAIDLSPTDPEYHLSHFATILDEVGRLAAPALVPRKRPTFTEGVFSQQAIIAGARSGQEETVFFAVEHFLQRTGEILQQTPHTSFSDEAELRRSRWLAAEQKNRKEHNALAQIFGASFAAQYLEHFLFGTAEQGRV